MLAAEQEVRTAVLGRFANQVRLPRLQYPRPAHLWVEGAAEEGQVGTVFVVVRAVDRRAAGLESLGSLDHRAIPVHLALSASKSV